MFQKATKAQTFLRMALMGPPGSGKTYSSLCIAEGLGKKIALIDTERGSASKYAELVDFDVMELAEYHPKKYIEAMYAAHKGEYDVLIIDSLSHAWAGKGGVLEIVDRAKGKGGNQFNAWAEPSKLQQELVDTILRIPMHVIVTMRSKMAYVVEENERGKSVPRKVGMAPVQRDGVEYEFDVVGEMSDATLHITKSRLDFLQGEVIEGPGTQLGQSIFNFLRN